MRVGLIGENSIEYINALLNIWNNGDCAVLIDWRIPHQTAVEMMQEALVQKCYIENKVFEKGENLSVSGIEFEVFKRKSNSAELLPQEIYDKFAENYTRSEAVVIYSSGTTGKAKGIILSNFAINTNADAIIDYMKPDENDCIYIAKTISHSSTLTGELLVALKTRIRLVIAPVVVSSRFVLSNILKFGVTTLCVNPTLLSMYAEEYSKNRYDITSLRVIYVSGSILSDRVCKLAHETFDGIPIYNVYGLSEAGPRITAQRVGYCSTNSVGSPIKGVRVAIVDEDGNEVSRGERGVVHVNTPSQCDGYVTGIEKLMSLSMGWLNTGDVGFIDEFDELHIVDRVDDVIIIDSHKIYPNEVEKQIIAHTPISECVVVKLEFKGNEFVGCLYVSEYNNKDSLKDKLKAILLSYEIPRYFFRCETVPKTMNGKISQLETKILLKKALEMEQGDE